ncbi:retrotransposable element [Pimephales promelas]|nr:retrotransposable element [Pimephales promelas]
MMLSETNLSVDFREKFITGEKDLSEKDLTFKKACDVALALELAQKDTKQLSAQAALKDRSVHKVQNVGGGREKYRGWGNSQYSSKKGAQQKPLPKHRGNCYRCGRGNHHPTECHYRNEKCHNCGKVGHLQRVCKNHKTQRLDNAQYVSADISDNQCAVEDDLFELFTVYSAQDKADGIYIDLQLNGITVSMQIDTGASLSLIPEHIYTEKLKDCSLSPTAIHLASYTGDKIPVLGEIKVPVTYEGQQCSLPLIVVKGDKPPLLGRNWLQKISLNWKEYPLPNVEDLFATLAGGKVFSKIDLSFAYQQLELDAESEQYLTINTHKGLFKYHRLAYGISTAPAIFQHTMDQILQGLQNVVCFMDDILVSAPSPEEHLEVLDKVLSRLQQHGIRVKKSKCEFLCKSVEYLGFKIDEKGLHPTESKVEAIVKAPAPTNVSELRSFLGLLNYYGKFVANLSTLLQWSLQCAQAFNACKQHLLSSKWLAHYDPKKPLRLACDASPYGVGAVISHVLPSGEEHPIAFASRTLTASEKNYAQIEKEALSIVFGVKKFHKYLYGRKFHLLTDHKPLLAILGPKSAIPTLAALRMQRWALTLLAYDYEIEYRRSSDHANADALSRLPPALNRSGILWGSRVIIPPKYRERLLSELHEGHPGVIRMKALARGYLWWPGLDQDIQNFLTNTEKTINLLRHLWAAYGFPKELVSDNGPPFTSREFEEFLRNNGVRHILSPPYHPATNGQAERVVQTFKKAWERLRAQFVAPHLRLVRFLLTYRNTPHTVTERTPAELFLKRLPRIRLTLLKPDTSAVVLKHQAQQKNAHDTPSRKLRSFEVGQNVRVRNCRHLNRAWLPGVILFKHGPLTYQVQVGDRSEKVHVDHLLSSNVQDRTDAMGSTMANDFAPDVSDKADPSVTQPHVPVETGTVPGPERRYPVRKRKAPNRLDL